jgi:type I restriction enzyme S subunit
MLFPDTEHPWQARPLGEIFELSLKGLNPANFPREEFHHYSIPAWDELGGPILDFGKEIDSGKLLLEHACVLVSKLNPQIPRVRSFEPPTDGRRACASTEIMPFVPRDSTARIDFFKHYFSSDRFRKNLVSAATGTTNSHKRVRPPQTLQWMVPVPEPDEQAAIARVLDAVDATIDRVRGAASQAAEVKRALVQELFSKGSRGEPQKKSPVGFIPKSWDVKPVNAVVTNFEYGLSLPMHLKGDTPILRMGNIQQGDVVMDELKYVTLSQALLERYLLKRGDVLFNRTNSQELVGKLGIYRSDAPAVFASYLIRLHADAVHVDNYYLGQ